MQSLTENQQKVLKSRIIKILQYGDQARNPYGIKEFTISWINEINLQYRNTKPMDTKKINNEISKNLTQYMRKNGIPILPIKFTILDTSLIPHEAALALIKKLEPHVHPECFKMTMDEKNLSLGHLRLFFPNMNKAIFSEQFFENFPHLKESNKMIKPWELAQLLKEVVLQINITGNKSDAFTAKFETQVRAYNMALGDIDPHIKGKNFNPDDMSEDGIDTKNIVSRFQEALNNGRCKESLWSVLHMLLGLAEDAYQGIYLQLKEQEKLGKMLSCIFASIQPYKELFKDFDKDYCEILLEAWDPFAHLPAFSYQELVAMGYTSNFESKVRCIKILERMLFILEAGLKNLEMIPASPTVCKKPTAKPQEVVLSSQDDLVIFEVEKESETLSSKREALEKMQQEAIKKEKKAAKLKNAAPQLKIEKEPDEIPRNRMYNTVYFKSENTTFETKMYLMLALPKLDIYFCPSLDHLDLKSEVAGIFQEVVNAGELLTRHSQNCSGIKIYGEQAAFVKPRNSKDRLGCYPHLIQADKPILVYLPEKIYPHKKYIDLINNKTELDKHKKAAQQKRQASLELPSQRATVAGGDEKSTAPILKRSAATPAKPPIPPMFALPEPVVDKPKEVRENNFNP